MSRNRDPVPQIPVGAILRYLGFDDALDLTDGYQKLRCRFHDERTPSASASRYGFKCYGCGRQGDAIKLLKEAEGLSFADALERATALAGSTDQPVPRRSGWGDNLLT